MGAAQIGRFPALAGEEENLTLSGELQEIVQGGGQALVVEVDQGVVQDDGRGLLLRQDQPAHRQAHRQIELVRRAAAEKRGLVGDQAVRLLGGGGHLPVQQHPIILPPCQLCKYLRRFFSQGGRKSVLQICVPAGEKLRLLLPESDGVAPALDLAGGPVDGGLEGFLPAEKGPQAVLQLVPGQRGALDGLGGEGGSAGKGLGGAAGGFAGGLGGGEGVQIGLVGGPGGFQGVQKGLVCRFLRLAAVLPGLPLRRV